MEKVNPSGGGKKGRGGLGMNHTVLLSHEKEGGGRKKKKGALRLIFTARLRGGEIRTPNIGGEEKRGGNAEFHCPAEGRRRMRERFFLSRGGGVVLIKRAKQKRKKKDFSPRGGAFFPG